jgi:hypothetical protein
MPHPKRAGTPISFRLPPDLAEHLEGLIAREPDWTKVEAVAVALHAFLRRPKAERLQDLMNYRGRHPEELEGPAPESGKGAPRKK